MSRESADSLTVGPVAATELPEVLRLLFSRADPSTRPSQIEAVLGEIDEASGRNQILLAARRNGRLVAAVWLQIRAGRVASLNPPGLEAGEPDETVVGLIESAVLQAFVAGVQFVQALSDTGAGSERRWLQSSSFKHGADLLYLVSPSEQFPAINFPTKLRFQRLEDSPSAMGRLTAIIERTYEGSQDCPAIHGMQPVGDAMASYRATGEFDASRWFIVRKNQADIGCLLLAEHPQMACPLPRSKPIAHDWELIYMGLIPEARGQEHGIDIVRYAQWLAAEAGAERLVLAVDAANAPAIRVYSAAGFQTWDRRSVFLRTK